MTSLKSQVQSCISPQCPSLFAKAVTEFSNWVKPYHAFTFGNKNSIFSGTRDIARELTSYLATKSWHGIELIEELRIDRLGQDQVFEERHKVISKLEAEQERQRPKFTLFNLPHDSQFDLIEREIFNAENDIIFALRISFASNDYRSEDHSEYVAILQTARKLLEFLRSRAPQKALFTMSSDGEETRIKPKPHPDVVPFCKLCWRQARANPTENRNLTPNYCRIHNQKRVEIAKEHFNIAHPAASKYRHDHRKATNFTEVLKDIERLVVAGTIVIPRVGTVLGQFMRMRYIAYHVAKHTPSTPHR